MEGADRHINQVATLHVIFKGLLLEADSENDLPNGYEDGLCL